MRSNRRSAVWAAALVVACGIGMSASPQQGPPAPAAPATGFLAGQIVEYPSGRPVAGATVTLLGRNDPRIGPRSPVLTDTQGRFYFANLLPGPYQTQV
ncbi:MAG: carboxypeptidase-like regulatory domain-containing protein, partial [Acidobacteriota bacterium]